MTAGAPCAVAIVGAGGMAREHARSFADVPGVRLAGIHSRSRPRAEALAREFGIDAVCDSVGELYERTRAALVVVTVVELAMSDVARRCCAYPWTLLLEKPPGYNLADALRIQHDAGAHGRQVLVALNRRFHSATRAALARLDAIDGPRFVQALDQQDPAGARAAGQPESVVRYWMYANAIHVIDYLRVFGRGSALAVPVVPWNPDAPGVVVSRIEFASGDIGLYEGIWDGPGPWACFVSTAAERWELRPLERAAFQRRGERQLHPVDVDAWDTAFKPGFRLQARHAAAAATGHPSASVTLADAIDTMRLVSAIFGTD